MWICYLPVCEEIQRRIRNIQHKVGKMSLIDPTRHKRKSTFFTATPTTSSESTASSPTDVATSPSTSNAPTLNFNVKNPRKALLEKLLEPGDRLVQTVQVNKDLNSFFEKKFLLKIKFQSLKQSTIPYSFWTVFFQLEGQWIRKLCIVCHGSEFCLLGADFYNNEENESATIGLVVKVIRI